MSFLFRRKNTIVREIKPLKPKSKWRFLWWGVAVVVVGIIGWFSTTAFLAYQNLSSANDSEDPAFFKYGDNMDINNLTIEGGSRINVLLLGNGGSTHPGGNLTDSIQVLSIDPVNKTMSYLSIPRDLYVTQADGTKSKINAVYSNGAAYCKVKTCATGVDQGGAAMKAMVSSIIGQPIHYFIKIDFSGFEKIIDTLGGIDIYVDKAIYDPYYPDSSMTGYSTFSIKAGQQHMTGATALKYARSRETTSDFDRARRQQQVISAVREKALSAGVLTNPTKISSIITTLGTHLKTDISLTNITKFASLIKEVDGHQGNSIVLDTATSGPLKSNSSSASGYTIIPRLGENKYSDLQIFILKVFSEPYLIKENAKISLINATGKTSGVDSLATQLKDMGYNIIKTTNATSSQTKTTIAGGDSSAYTLALLKKRFSVSSVGKINSSDTSGADIVLTIGSDYSLK